MTNDAPNFATQTRQRLLGLLALLEKDKAALSNATPEAARSGSEMYGQFIAEVRRGLDDLDAKVD